MRSRISLGKETCACFTGGMARRPRIDTPGIPQHVVQRGNNRAACFHDDQDRREYLAHLRDALDETGCQLHAYVLMTNHVHLLLTPGESGAVAQLMQKLGRRYVGWFNLRHGRSGTLWEGRYKACPVDTDTYLLQCSRYIDLNPVRAGLAEDPACYRWSSCAGLCGLRPDPLLSPHSLQQELGHPSDAPGSRYRRFLAEAIADDELQAIRTHLKLQRPPRAGSGSEPDPAQVEPAGGGRGMGN
jgi:putative transposase